MRVVVALDGRPGSQAIIDALIKMHWPDGAELSIVTVFSPTSAEGEDFASAIAEMESLVAELRKPLHLCDIQFIPTQGDPKAEIMRIAEEISADVIVLGSNCKNTLERLLLGSVSQAVINGAQCPVIVAKTPCCLARELSPAYRSVLIPIDKSIFSDAAIRWLANFDWAPSTQFVVASVVEDDTDPKEVQLSLTRRAVSLSNTLRTNNVVTTTIHGRGSQSIIDLAKHHYTDLIVMGAHNRTGLKKLLLGEIADQVSHGAPCAVAIVEGVIEGEGDWSRTEAFGKIEPPVQASTSAWDYGNKRERDHSPRVMPGGF